MQWQADDSDNKVDMSGWRKPSMILAYSDDGKPRPLRWLWPGHIPFGALTLFDDFEKPWFHSPAIDLIARATNGDAMSGGALGLGGPVLVLADDDETFHVEFDDDGVDVTAALSAAGVDRKRLTVMPGIPVWDADSKSWFPDMCYLPEGAWRLDAALRPYDYRLFIIDHLGLFVDQMMWSPSYQETRIKLAPLARLAQDRNLVVLILRCHESMFPVPLRGWGAGDIPRRTVPRIRWVGDSRYTEYERIIAEARFGWYERERLDIWLRNELAAGPVPVKELEWLAADEGWTPKQLRSAKQRPGVLAHRQGFGADGYSLWSLSWKPRS